MLVHVVPAAIEVHVELAAETLFHIGPIPVTNSMLTMFIVMALILVVLGSIARRATMVPGRPQAAFEVVAEFLLNLVESTAGRTLGRRIYPLIGALFIFIIVANYSGLLPGVGVVGFYEEEETADEASNAGVRDVAELPGGGVVTTTLAQEGTAEGEGEAGDQEGVDTVPATTEDDDNEAAAGEEEHEKVLVPYFRSPNADLNMTLAMALLTFTTVQVLGIRANGFIGRLKHMADPPFLFPIEVISELSRIISLSFRLFGNVFAGEVLLALMVALANAIKIVLIPVLIPVIFLFLEVLFGFIQALVFALLTLIYISLAAAGHGDEEHEHEGEAATGHGATPASGQAVPAGSGD
jgi:F-type H+-transporting ATPase subunit a